MLVKAISILAIILLLSIFNSNLSYEEMDFFGLSNIPLNGTISPVGCNSVNGTISNEQVNSLRTKVCHFKNYKFLITNNAGNGCIQTQSSWKDPQNNKTLTIRTPCDVPNWQDLFSLGNFFHPVQLRALGIPFDKISCKDSWQPLVKPPSQNSICVKLQTAEKLEKLGWINLQPLIPL